LRGLLAQRVRLSVEAFCLLLGVASQFFGLLLQRISALVRSGLDRVGLILCRVGSRSDCLGLVARGAILDLSQPLRGTIVKNAF
jgi:hypothetical protein